MTPLSGFLYLFALRAALYKRGVPASLYVDNGSIYSSKEIIQICARVGCLLHHTPVRDGAAKGKVERFFRTVRDQFLAWKKKKEKGKRKKKKGQTLIAVIFFIIFSASLRWLGAIR